RIQMLRVGCLPRPCWRIPRMPAWPTISSAWAVSRRLGAKRARRFCALQSRLERTKQTLPLSSDAELRRLIGIELSTRTVPKGRGKELLQTVLRRVALAGSGLNLELLRRASALAIACGDEAAAENVLRQTIEEDPDDLDALAALTDICEKNNNAEEAYSLVTRQ